MVVMKRGIKVKTSIKKFMALILGMILILSACAVPEQVESANAGRIAPAPNPSKKTETTTFDIEDEYIEEISAIMHDGTNYWPTYAWPYRHLSKLNDNGLDYKFSHLQYYLNKISEKFTEDIESGKGYSSIFGYFDSVLVAHQGHIVYEYYKNYEGKFGTKQTWSLTKSFVSAIVGIAIGEGYISLDDKILDYFTDIKINNIDERKEAMTIRDVLTMQSGLKWDEDTSTRNIRNDENPIQVLLSVPMECDPGTQFSYNTSSSSILTTIIQKVTGKTTYEYAKEKIFDKIGIMSAEWETDNQGVNTGGFGLSMTSEDLLRFGYLYLHNGIWDGKQIIPAEWVKESTKTQVDLMTNGSKKAEEFKDSGSYGYHWWTPSGEYDITVKSDSILMSGDRNESGELVYNYSYFNNNTEFKDGDLFRATGFAGQYIYVIPKYDVVVVITGAVGNSPVDIGNYLVFNKILKEFKDYGEYIDFGDDEEALQEYSKSLEIDYSKYKTSDYLF